MLLTVKYFFLVFEKKGKVLNVRRGEKKIEEDGVVVLIKRRTMLKEKEWKRNRKKCWL